MLNFTEFAARHAAQEQRPLTLLRGVLWGLFGLRPFADVPDQKLADHRWALQSALFRAVHLRDGEGIDSLQKLHDAMEREMRHRGLL